MIKNEKELEKWNAWLKQNYNSIKATLQQAMYFQNWGNFNEDLFDETILRIGESIAYRQYVVDYNRILRLIFISYKNVTLRAAEREKYCELQFDTMEYTDEPYVEIDTTMARVMSDDIEDYFKSLPDYIKVWRKKMNEEMLTNREGIQERQIWEELKTYLKTKYNPKHPRTRRKMNINTPVFQHSLNKEFIKKFDSIKEASRYGYDEKGIRKSLTTNQQYAGYFWTRNKIYKYPKNNLNNY